MKNDYLNENNKEPLHREGEDGSHTKLEIYKDVEKFKLAIWIAKTFSIFLLLIVSSLVISYLYVSISTKQLADLSAAGSLLSGFFEVIKVIIAP
jgi:hypothetical protein